MAENMDTKKLTEYRHQISNAVVENIKESLSKMEDAIAMITDLQSINEALSLALVGANNDKERKEQEISELKETIESMKMRINQAEIKERKYEELDISMEKVTTLLITLDEKEKELTVLTEKLNKERVEFEEEREIITSAKAEAEEKTKINIKKKNEAIKSRDEAIAERDKAIKDKKDAEDKNRELSKLVDKLKDEKGRSNDKIEQLESDLEESYNSTEWYRDYAIALDKKIVDYYRYKIGDLESHYYSYLNNPEKLDEIHEHFPDYLIEENNGNANNSDNESEIKRTEEERKTEECEENFADNKEKERKNSRNDRPEFD